MGRWGRGEGWGDGGGEKVGEKRRVGEEKGGEVGEEKEWRPWKIGLKGVA